MAIKFLAINSGYKEAEFAIYQDQELCAYLKEDNKKISKSFIFYVEKILTDSDLSFADLSFIAANKGPAPFTTLRVSLASINGLSFATGIPLVGVNGLIAFLEEHKNPKCVTIAILNAFANDLYYAIYNPFDETIIIGCEQSELFFKYVDDKFQNEIVIIGNGVINLEEKIKLSLTNKFFIPSPLPDYVSIKTIANIALDNFLQKKNISFQVMPLYLKDSSTKLIFPKQF